MTPPKLPDTPTSDAAATTAAPETDAPIESRQLLRGRSCVTIEHRGTRYRLQETKAGKLILTK